MGLYPNTRPRESVSYYVLYTLAKAQADLVNPEKSLPRPSGLVDLHDGPSTRSSGLGPTNGTGARSPGQANAAGTGLRPPRGHPVGSRLPVDR